MRETLVCIGKIGKEPYVFSETGTRVYSYEEMCYYFSSHMICYLHSLPEEDLAVYVRDELGMDRLYRSLIRLTDPLKDQMKYFAAFFREGTYFSEDEIRDILDRYRKLKNASLSMQSKWLGDLFLDCGRANMARHYYERALREEDLSREMTGEVYHNLGIALVRLFRFQDGRIAFLKSYQAIEDENSLFYYYCIVALTQDMQKATAELKEFDVSDLVLESFEIRFSNMSEEFACCEEALTGRRIRFLEKNGRPEEAAEVKKEMIHRLQGEFRKQIDLDEKLFVTNLPVRYSIDEKQIQEEQ